MASISTDVDEANRLLEAGHKFLKTGLLRWVPNHEKAAERYMEAAAAFKDCGLHQKAIDANELAIKNYLETRSSQFGAAKCMNQAASSCLELRDYQGVAKYYDRAVDLYRSLGHLDTAISVSALAAKLLSIRLPTLAADLYIKAWETSVIEDRHLQAAEYCNNAANLYLKDKEYKKAANIACEEINCYVQADDTRTCSRIAIGVILIHLADNDIVSAMDALKRYQMDDEVYSMAKNLVEGFDKKDALLLKSTLDNSYFRNLDNEYAKIARELLREYGKVDLSKQSEIECDETPEHYDDLR